MRLLSEFAVFLAVAGSLVMVIGVVFYFGLKGNDQQVINPKFGVFAHKKFLLGIGLYHAYPVNPYKARTSIFSPHGFICPTCGGTQEPYCFTPRPTIFVGAAQTNATRGGLLGVNRIGMVCTY